MLYLGEIANLLRASLLIVQFIEFSNIHAYLYRLRCSFNDSKDVPAIKEFLHYYY
jgi:hypothetical protein